MSPTANGGFPNLPFVYAATEVSARCPPSTRLQKMANRLERCWDIDEDRFLLITPSVPLPTSNFFALLSNPTLVCVLVGLHHPPQVVRTICAVFNQDLDPLMFRSRRRWGVHGPWSVGCGTVTSGPHTCILCVPPHGPRHGTIASWTTFDRSTLGIPPAPTREM